MHLAVLESFVQKMGSMFAYQSSEVDWCEENYKYSDHVAEFYNTVSNVGFFICAPLMMYLQHPYARERTLAVHLFWLMLIIVGVFSAYYHMTLSYIGQMLDEISILWIIAVAYAIWYPRVHFPNFIKNRHHFITMVFITASVSTLVIFMKPIMNAYILNCTTFHVLYTLKLELKKCPDPRIHRLAVIAVFWWVLAITCWISDRVLCEFWRAINFTYLHSFWHIFITITVVHSTALFTYFDAMYEIPECLPEVQYWPCNSWLLGLPYLAVQSSRKLKKDC
ncbi:alkaline ceramidase 1 isoform X1 [Rhinatrema bivittatum]|uniref:alkaline ceramidase 1 isoform X1 n=1 Tax=Rhinatrema bivittatum TaxID=194408 RepID=UPI00112A90B2|nr:alkaline ceramidase 1 isoform X1 [Rhinatrema bivittatum]